MEIFSEEVLERIKRLPPHQQKELLDLSNMLGDTRSRERAREHFLDFTTYVEPDYTISAHNKEIARVFDGMLRGELNRVILNTPPRVGKSLLSSKLLPAYFFGKNPKKSIIHATHTVAFTTEWGRKVRDLVGSERYRNIFPDVTLKADSKAAGHWHTNHGGQYFAVGAGGAMVGRDGDLIIIDDPIDEQDGKLAAYKPEVFESTYQWFLAGPRQRMMPHSCIVIIMTRWGLMDLTGRILYEAGKSGTSDNWHVIEFPAIADDGHHIFPEKFPLDYWLGVKNEYPSSYWNSVYQQNPTSEEAALVKREWWKPWEHSRLPELEFVIQSWDTAYMKTQRSDFCACTTWGIFSTTSPDGRTVPAAILLDAYKERLEFPQLKQTVKRLYDEKKPDTLLIEAKAAGMPLVYELRSMGVPVSEYTPTRGNDKVARVNAISDLFKSGFIYFVPGKNTEEVIEEFAAFPTGAHDDLVDTATQALLRFRQGGLIKTSMDYDYEDEDEDPRPPVKYY